MKIYNYNEKDRSAVEELFSDNSLAKFEILRFLDENPTMGQLAKEEGKVIAVGVFSGFDKKSKLNLYVKPDRRNEGIGTKLLGSLEIVMSNGGVKEIVCSFEDKDKERSFSYKNGYKSWFYSNFMTYNDEIIKSSPLGIRQYKDDDYSQCQKVYSEAFYKMGQMVGFETTLSEPSEKEREAFLNNAENIFVITENDTIVASATIDGNEIDIVAVAVEEQGKGYGKRIISYCVNELINRGNQEIVLWCVDGNPAKHVYEKLGFKADCLHEFVKKKL